MMSKRNSRFKSIVSPVDDTCSMIIIQNEGTTMMRSQMAQNCVVVWLNLDTNYSNENVDRSIIQLQYVAQSVRLFTDSNQCIDFITDVVDEEVFLIVSGPHIQQLVSNIEDIKQLYSIYIFDTQDTYNEVDFRVYRKVKGIFIEIQYICGALKQDISRLMVDSTPFSIVPITSSPNFNELDPSFMYTQLIKEAILEIEPDKSAKEQFVHYYLTNFDEKQTEMNVLQKFQQSYIAQDAILWYARESFVYETINKALRTQDTKTIIKMGFFLRDLHRQIEQKYSTTPNITKIILYRGQGMSNDDFGRLAKNEGGLISFNCFLSTSLKRNVSFMYGDSACQNPELTGILFRIEIDSSISSTPFVNVNDIGYSPSEEQEILFSMHTVFRIGKMQRIKDRLWEVNLTFTSDNNSQLKLLTDWIRNQLSIADGWYRLACLMLQMGKINDALEIFNTLQQTACDDDDDPGMPHIAQSVVVGINAQIYTSTEIKSKSFVQLKKTLEHWENTLPLDDPMFGIAYVSMSQVYQSNGDYVTALTYLEKALNIFQQCSLSDKSVFGVIHISIGELHRLTGNHQLALSDFEKALDILQKSCPSNHPNLVLVYNRTASVYADMNNVPMVLSNLEKALAIQQSLPSDHPILVVNNFYMGQMHQWMGDYLTALSYYQKASKICQNSYSLYHPNHAMIYKSLAVIYQSMKDNTTANSYFQKALEIQEKTLAIQRISISPNHPDLVVNLKQVGEIHYHMGNHEVALSHYEQVLEIWQKSSSIDQLNLADIYNKIGAAHQSMGRCHIAAQYFEKAHEIQKKSLPFDHPDLIETYDNIASSNVLNGDLLSTVSNWEKMYHIGQKYLSDNRPSHVLLSENLETKRQEWSHLAKAASKMKQVAETQQKLIFSDRRGTDWTENDTDEYKHMLDDCSDLIQNFKAVSQVQQVSNGYVNAAAEDQPIENCLNTASNALKSVQKLFSTNHAESTRTNSDDSMTQSTNDNMLMLQQSFQQIMESVQQLHSPNDPSAAIYYDYIGNVLYSLGDYWSALTYFEKSLEIILTSSTNNHPLLAKTYSNMAKALDGCERYKEAVDCAEQAIATARQNLESTTSEQIEAYEKQLLQLLQKMG